MSVELPNWGVICVDAPDVRNTDELAPWSDIVASGEIVSFADGEVRHETGGSTLPVIAHIDHVAIHEGSLPETSDGSLYVALVAPAGAQAVAESIPIGTEVLVYGVVQNAPDDADQSPVVKGMPTDQPLYGVVHPAGLVFELKTRGEEPALAWPMYGSVVEGGTIEDALPGEPVPDEVDESGIHEDGSCN